MIYDDLCMFVLRPHLQCLRCKALLFLIRAHSSIEKLYRYIMEVCVLIASKKALIAYIMLLYIFTCYTCYMECHLPLPMADSYVAVVSFNWLERQKLHQPPSAGFARSESMGSRLCLPGYNEP